MMQAKLIFWDWTGTLADESALDKAVCASMEKELAEKENITFEESETRFKAHLRKLENTWQWGDYVLHGRALGVDWKRCQQANLKKLAVLPHALEILEYARQKGYKNILATNAVREVIVLRADSFGMTHLFDSIIASDDVNAMKSEGKHFERGLETFIGDPRLSFSVGDNPVQDILSARKYGMKTIFCDFGQMMHYHSAHISNEHNEKAEADYTVKSLQEIKGII